MSNENTINGLRALAQEQFKKIDEAVDLLEHIEAEVARLKPGYRSGTIGKKLVRHTADKLFRFACREEMRHYACLADVAADLERLADKVDSLKERSSACAKIKFGRLVRCPKAGIFSAAAGDPRVRQVAKAFAKAFPPDPRRAEVLHGTDLARWCALSTKAKRAANKAALRRAVAVEVATRYQPCLPRYDLL